MIDIILPNFTYQILVLLPLIFCISFALYMDYVMGYDLGKIAIVTMTILFLAMWGFLSIFGWIPEGSIIPSGPQIFNISIGGG